MQCMWWCASHRPLEDKALIAQMPRRLITGSSQLRPSPQFPFAKDSHFAPRPCLLFGVAHIGCQTTSGIKVSPFAFIRQCSSAFPVRQSLLGWVGVTAEVLWECESFPLPPLPNPPCSFITRDMCSSQKNSQYISCTQTSVSQFCFPRNPESQEKYLQVQFKPPVPSHLEKVDKIFCQFSPQQKEVGTPSYLV